MGWLKNITKIFWNYHEKRLRAVWRLGLHANVLIALSIFIVILLILPSLIIDWVLGMNAQSILSGSGSWQFFENPWFETVVVPFATLIGVVVTTYGAGKWIDRRKFKAFGLRINRDWWRDFAFGLGLGAVLMGLIFLFGLFTGLVKVTQFFMPLTQNVSFISGFIQSLILFLCVGFYEELLSRGYHLINLAEGFNIGKINKKWALILALLLSSLIFGLLHMGNPNATWVSTLNISLAGIFLGLGMVLTGSLAIPIGLHITWNFFQGNVFGFPVSGTIVGSTVIATEWVGPQWLTGGAFGPEAGILGLAAMMIGSALTLLWVRRKGRLSLNTALAVYEPPLIDKIESQIHSS